MAQPIFCSAPGEPHEADAIIGLVANGDQTMLCFGHLEDWCRAYLDAVSQAEADETAAETERRLAGVHPPAGSTEAQPDDAGLSTDAKDGAAPEFPTSGESSDADAALAVPPGGDASASESEQVAQTATDEAIAPPRGSESPTEDTE